MNQFEPGQRLDDFIIDECVHSGGMARIYRTHRAEPARQPGFPLVMKVPRMTAGDGAETLLGFEVEAQILSLLHGPYAPRFVAAGDAAKTPYIVMEYIEGETLQQRLDRAPVRDAGEIARLGAAIARAVHGLHRQEVCHLDLKPANVLLRANDEVVLLDFGLAWHARRPDMLAENQRATAGSYVWMAPEQVVGVRGDPRSDVFAIGVMLYEMCTRELPFGDPQTRAGLRQRLWMQPKPPRQIDARIPEWLQEIVMCCLEPLAENRYATAASLAFDLSHPQQVGITARGRATRAPGIMRQWFAAAGRDYVPSALLSPQQAQAPIVMAAVPHRDAAPAILDALCRAASRSLGTRPGARLACVTVVPPGGMTDTTHSEVAVHQQMLAYLRQWTEKVELRGHPASYHVLESPDVAQAILTFAATNNVNIILLGAATHGLQLQRFVATVPIKVAMHAPCTVMLVKVPDAHGAAAAAAADVLVLPPYG